MKQLNIFKEDLQRIINTEVKVNLNYPVIETTPKLIGYIKDTGEVFTCRVFDMLKYPKAIFFTNNKDFEKYVSKR